MTIEERYLNCFPDDLPDEERANAAECIRALTSQPYPLLPADRENTWWEHFEHCLKSLRWPDDYWTPIHVAFAMRRCVMYANDMTSDT